MWNIFKKKEKKDMDDNQKHIDAHEQAMQNYNNSQITNQQNLYPYNYQIPASLGSLAGMLGTTAKPTESVEKRLSDKLQKLQKTIDLNKVTIENTENQIKEMNRWSETTNLILQDLKPFSTASYDENLYIEMGKVINKHIEKLEFNNKLKETING